MLKMFESSKLKPKTSLSFEPIFLDSGIAKLSLLYRSEESVIAAIGQQGVLYKEQAIDIVYKPKRIQLVGISGQVREIFYNSIDDFKNDIIMPDSEVAYPKYLLKGNPPQIFMYEDCGTDLNLDMIVVRLNQVSEMTKKPQTYDKFRLSELKLYILYANLIRFREK